MKKEEFPTFLNEQPTIVFGRTGRELLIIVCGLFAGFRMWGDLSVLLPGVAGNVLGIVLCGAIIVAFLVLALVKAGYRHLEEWLFAWLLFATGPKVYLYKPVVLDVELLEEEQEMEQAVRQAKPAALDMDDLD
jgi:hypothetical protein